MQTFRRLIVLLGATIYLVQFGCSSPLTSLLENGDIKLSVKGNTSPAPSGVGKTTAAVTITSASIVIDKIEFESEEDLFDFELENPFVHDLVPNANLHEIGTFTVPFGTYEEIEIEIEQLGESSALPFEQNPELQNRSIRITGFLNGNTNEAFEFTSDLSAEQEKEFNPPITLDEDSPSANIVLSIDMSMWFVDESSNVLDPRIIGNRSAIEDNIKASIQVFEDEDDDGEEDDDEDDEDDD